MNQTLTGGDAAIRSRLKPGHPTPGFTLLELLVVVGIIGILAGLLLPVLARAKARAQAVQCVANFRTLQVAWLVFADEHQDRLPPNAPVWRAGFSGEEPSWVAGWMAYTEAGDPYSDHATNEALLLMPGIGHLGPLVGSAKPFKCPGDRQLARVGGKPQRRVRTCSMNVMISGATLAGDGSRQSHAYALLSDMTDPGPSRTFVFVDEHEDTLSHPAFLWPTVLSRDINRGPWEAMRLPAYRHGQGGTLSFADGHVEIKQWRDPRTRAPITGTYLYGRYPLMYNNLDFTWLRLHAFRYAPGMF